ncbi:unnamed protein product [Prunus armeniaca]
MVDEDEDDAKLASSNSRSINYLKQQLRVAWSHNPLTTLKLICNLYAGKRYYLEAFENHLLAPPEPPKTLACNAISIAYSFGGLRRLLLKKYLVRP